MADFLNRFKRKSRSSDSDLETKSPEGKKRRVCDESSPVLHEDDAITLPDNTHEEDKILQALDMSQNIGFQLQQILNKLEALEAKFETVVTTVNNLTSTVEGLKKTVDKVQSKVTAVESKTTKLREDVDTMDKSLSFLDKEFQELKVSHKAEIKRLEDKILYQEVYDRRENLRFLFSSP